MTEYLIICLRYFDTIEIIFNWPKSNYEIVNDAYYYLFSCEKATEKVNSHVLDKKSLAQAHRYVLLHSNKIYI